MNLQTILAFEDELKELEKEADVVTKLQPHQQRVVERMQREDQPGLVVAHGLGSGKTLTSIAAQDALGLPADVIVPAALQENYRKEIKRHTKGKVPHTAVQSMQNLATKGIAPKRKMMVVDEAHRMRDPSSATFQTLKGTEAQKRLLLTGSPFYNHPSDIAPLIDLAANRKVLPFDREEFTRRYIAEKTINPSFAQKALNVFRSEENKVRPGTVPILYEKMAPELREAFGKWVDYHPGSKDAEGFPSVERKNVNVPMSKEQLRVYDTLMDKAPAWVAAKVKRGLPPDKREAQQLNAFLTASRQAANTTSPFIQDQKNTQDPKIQMAFNSLQKTLKDNPRARAVVYSNFLKAGIDPYKARLDAAKIPYGEFTGEMPKKKRDELVRQYNEGKLRALLLSSAGGEGLDLKGTRLMQIMEPHWNMEKLKQVEGRGARYKSHADLPPEERKLLVENYLATRPQGLSSKVMQKVLNRAPDKSVDEYLTQMSGDKEKLIDQFRALLPNKQKEKTSADLVRSDKNSKSGRTTEASKELASSLKPRLAAMAAYTLPGASMGYRLGRGVGGGAGGAVLGVAGAAVGQLIANTITGDLVNQGKALARQALKRAAFENTLREQAGKMDYKEIARSTGKHLSSDLLANSSVIGNNITRNIHAGKPFSSPLTPVDAALMGGTAIAGAIGSGYLDKYRRMIAVNELDNVKAHEADKEVRKLQRLRSQVANLETKVEGDGWNAPKKEDSAPVVKPKNKRIDW